MADIHIRNVGAVLYQEEVEMDYGTEARKGPVGQAIEKRIVVPEGMYSAAAKELTSMWGYSPECAQQAMSGTERTVRKAIECALRWLSENPIAPTERQFDKLYEELSRVQDGRITQRGVVEWQRRMFEPQAPEEIADLLWDARPYLNKGAEYRHDEAVKEAYRRGKESARS